MNRVDLRPRHRSSGRVGAAGRGRIRVALGLAAMGLLGWHLMSGRDDGPPADTSNALTTTPPAPTETAAFTALEVTQAPSVAAEEQLASAARSSLGGLRSLSRTPTAVTEPSASHGEQARAVLEQLRAQRTDVDPMEVYTRAEEFQQAGMLADAYLLYFFAARQGHAMSAMALGTIYDPDYHSPFTSLTDEPDLFQAHKWYLQAAQAGDPVAKEHLEHLRKRVELAAADGDPEAQRLVLQWR